MKTPKDSKLRKVPSVDRLLEHPDVIQLISETSQPFVVNLLRKVLQAFRHEILAGIAKDSEDLDPTPRLLMNLETELQHWTRPQLKKVINATGILIHTNLGRAPLPEKCLEELVEVAGGYSNLEFDTEKGTRGNRDVFANRLFQEILGCEQAIVVNNCAAALFLAVNTLAEGSEVLISRGELIEIGDSFRIPDILRKSGASLREVGTTNKTRLSDYAEAISDQTRMIVRVHPSNFRIVGFTSRPTLEELIELSQMKGVPLLEDLGSGCLVDLKPFGITDEPNPKTSLASGVPLICFSGDKLLGGPQAGILAGREDLIRAIRKNPLFRAVRVDKLTLAVLEGTLISYLEGRSVQEIPLLRLIHSTSEEIGQRADAIVAQLKLPSDISITVTTGESMIGGGSTPYRGVPSKLLLIASRNRSVASMEHRLRMNIPPVLGRLEDNRLVLDLRTVFPQEDKRVVQALQALCQE